MVTVLLINGSSRENGNSEKLAKYMLEEIPYEEINLREFNIQLISDKRHDVEGFDFIDDDYMYIFEKFLHAETVIFSSPVYWYGISGNLKVFIDRWSESLRKISNMREKVKGKEIYLVLVGGDEPREKGMPIVNQFQHICDFLSMDFQNYVIGEGNKPDDILNDTEAIRCSKEINKILLEERKHNA